jgi:hypothetical protein
MKSRPEIPASWMRLILGDVTDYGKTVKTEPSQIPAKGFADKNSTH